MGSNVKDKNVDDELKDMKEWMGLLDDKQRADVIKSWIAEREKTERTRIEREAEIAKNMHDGDGFWFVRAGWVIATIVAVACSTYVAHEYINRNKASVTQSTEAAAKKPQ